MTVSEWLRQAEDSLNVAGVGTARLDALVLLEDVTGQDRAWLLAHGGQTVSAQQAAKLKKLLIQRARHIPLAYVRGKTEFYGREFVLAPTVLEPRPESEAMIELLKDLVKDKGAGLNMLSSIRLADVGCGSGALGITAALELPKCRVDLLDIDAKALKIAKINVDKFTLTLRLVESDLLANSRPPYDVLLCNLPYVPDSYQINLAASHEPRQAIFGGPDGLELYRRLFNQIIKLTDRPLYILTESMPPQHQELSLIARQAGYDLTRENDFIQLFGRAN